MKSCSDCKHKSKYIKNGCSFHKKILLPVQKRCIEHQENVSGLDDVLKLFRKAGIKL